MVLKCELKQVKHDTVRGIGILGWKGVRRIAKVVIVATPTLLLLKYLLPTIYCIVSIVLYAIIALAWFFWMRDVRSKCNARRESNANQCGDDKLYMLRGLIK